MTAFLPQSKCSIAGQAIISPSHDANVIDRCQRLHRGSNVHGLKLNPYKSNPLREGEENARLNTSQGAQRS